MGACLRSQVALAARRAGHSLPPVAACSPHPASPGASRRPGNNPITSHPLKSNPPNSFGRRWPRCMPACASRRRPPHRTRPGRRARGSCPPRTLPTMPLHCSRAGTHCGRRGRTGRTAAPGSRAPARREGKGRRWSQTQHGTFGAPAIFMLGSTFPMCLLCMVLRGAVCPLPCLAVRALQCSASPTPLHVAGCRSTSMPSPIVSFLHTLQGMHAHAWLEGDEFGHPAVPSSAPALGSPNLAHKRQICRGCMLGLRGCRRYPAQRRPCPRN